MKAGSWDDVRVNPVGMQMLKAALSVVVLLGLVVAVGAAAEVHEGRFMFNKRCGTCHEATELMPRLMKLPNDAERGAFLDKFLARHHARDADERALIVEYLLRHQPR